jgi:hypothetical protein
MKRVDVVESHLSKSLAVVRAGCAVLLLACGERQYTWAFAQNMDNTLLLNETCRESLAESLYATPNREGLMRQGNSNVYLFTGVVESFRIYAYHSQSECEAALNGMALRQRR